MKKILIILSIICTLGLFAFHKYKQTITYPTSTIIILNGPSSVGKSSIQKELQNILEEPYLAMGFDNLAFLPPRFVSINGPTPPANEGIYLETSQENEHQIVTIHYGKYAQNMVRGIHRTFAAFASTDNNIIVDYILYDPSWLKDLVHVLKNFNVYWIGITAPLGIIEEREKQSGNRLLGHSRSHYATVHGPKIYDLMIDNSNLSPLQVAENIKEHIAKNKPKAFTKLENLK